MKTGILTYHNTRNCGAILQAYALQKILANIGVDSEIIDYRCSKIDEAYRIKKLDEIKSIKEFIKWTLTINSAKKSQKKFNEFKSKYLKLSEPYFKNTINKANDLYNAYITGSDQVWNFNLNGNDYTYLLDFASDSKKKLSYAASMGSKSMSKENEEIFAKSLLNYDGISVREKTLKAYVDVAIGIDSTLVLDPTLLLTKDDYNFASQEIEEKYIFVYTVASTPNIEKAAKELSKITGYKIIWGHMSYRKKKGVINKTDISPNEFINYIKNAEYVLTSSFHGMALSIVMEKQFFYDLDTKKENNNSRLETLAEVLGLQERELTAEKYNFNKDINYLKIRKILKVKRKESMDFLAKLSLKKQGECYND